MDSGGMPPDWKPPPPPEHGSKAWKRDMAVRWAIDERLMQSTGLYKCPIVEGVDCGYLAIEKRSGGTDYIHAENIQPGVE